MIVSWNWLKEYVALDVSVETVVERLMMAGFNHEATFDVEGDIAIDLEITSNRPDCLGHLGIARELAVLLGKELKIPAANVAESGAGIESETSVAIDPQATSWCPQYRARLIRGVKIGPSPAWIVRRLRTVGLTPINNVVDVTNYVLMECGQPLHAFDFDQLAGRKIIVRNARDKEAFLAINNKSYELSPGIGVIADAERAVAVAGVMGGAETEVSDRTTNVLLEAAEFAPVSIRRASRALDLSSDSSYRFERKIDPGGVAWASERAALLIAQLSGGSVACGFLHAGQSAIPKTTTTFRPARVSKLLGVEIPPSESLRTLTALGVDVAGDESGNAWTVTAPTHRRDLTREIDYVEEVGRIHGYADVPENVPLAVAVARRAKDERVLEIVRAALVGAGFCEAVTFSFTTAANATAVRPWSNSPPLAVRHSSRKLENAMRLSLIGSLLVGLRTNETRGNDDVRLFEIAHGYLPVANSPLPSEPLLLGIAAERLDFRQMRGVVDSILSRLRIHADLAPTKVAGLDEARTGEWTHDGKRIGVIGYANHANRERLDLKAEAVCAELIVEALVDAAELTPKVVDLPDMPAAVRDLAVVLDESTRWTELEATVRQSAGNQLESLAFVDLYRGKQVPAGKKSIAFRLTYRAADRTLTREEVDGYQQAVIDAVGKNLGGVLRM